MTSMARAELRRLGRASRLRSSCVQPRMAFSGVRSSCDSVARNSSLMRAVRCASMRALRSASSIVLALRAARLQRLGALAFGQVAGQLGESAQPAGFVAQAP